MSTLPFRNRLWTNQVQHYLVEVVSKCSSFKASASPPPNRRVPLATLSRQLYDVICIDHFHLDDVILFNATDTTTVYSASHAVQSTSLEEAVVAFESC